ncbi:MAG TPA: sigma-70 family RNA polymerase sigma factor [Gemmataceae bacterium]|nr:sigma-70 family RNA polymerase sigma factor [Gemmataceae bacterium]
MLSNSLRDRLDMWARGVIPRALAYAQSLLRDRTQAEDVVQESLFRLLRRADEYDLERDGVRLLFRAISNLCINETTRRKTITSLDVAGVDEGPIPVEDRLARLPEDELAGRELQTAISAGLERLPPLQRAALELRALGQGKAEIAEILQISESHAGVLVHRARLTLADDLRGMLRGAS